MLRMWAVLGTMALALGASAQQEQWLQYHTSREGRGYHWLELSTNPPAGVALPKLNAKPYFARWSTPMDPSGGRWVCFDSTRKSGPYDRAYIDSNGNGRLDDETALTANRIDQYYAYFDPARVVFKGEDGPITYHLVFQFMRYSDDEVRTLAMSGGYYAGTVNVGGKKRKIELVDATVNGAFDDRGSDAGDCDRVVVENDKAGERYLGRLLEVDGQFFRIQVAHDGAFVKLDPARDLSFGTVRVPETITEFIAFGENGHFIRKPVKGEFTLPAGKYRIHEWGIDRKDSKGAAWRLEGSGFDDAGKFEAAAEKPATLNIGEPVRAIMTANQTTNQVGFDLSFRGRLNEPISIRKGNQNPPGPRLTMVSLDGTYRSTNTFEFG